MTKAEIKLVKDLAAALKRLVSCCAECEGKGVMYYNGKPCYSDCRRDIALLKRAEKYK